MSAHSPLLTVMIGAAEKAARSLLRDFGEVEQLQVSQKGPGDFVTAADKRSEEIIYKELQKARPGYSFLMEESGAIKGEDESNIWIVDPLDGTTNFLHGIPHWCISIALRSKGEIIAGVIYDPVRDELFTGEKGGGSFMRRKRLRVSGRREFNRSMISCGFPMRAQAQRDKFNREFDIVQAKGANMRRTGSAALDLAYVAAGRFEAFWERDISAWDIAAGYVIIKEAGGFQCDLDDDRANPVDTGCILASNTHLYNDLKLALRNAHKS